LNPVISVAQVQPWDDLVLTGPPVQPPRATHLFQTLTRSKLSHKPIPPRLAISDLIPAFSAVTYLPLEQQRRTVGLPAGQQTRITDAEPDTFLLNFHGSRPHAGNGEVAFRVLTEPTRLPPPAWRDDAASA